jgi:translation initiation factor RLI1
MTKIMSHNQFSKMSEDEIQSLKKLQYEEFVQKSLTELIKLSNENNILEELIEHAKDIEMIDELSEALSNLRDEKILKILKKDEKS